MKYLTPSQVGQMLAEPVSGPTILHHIHLGRIQALRNGYYYTIPENEAQQFVLRHNAGEFVGGVTKEVLARRERDKQELAMFRSLTEQQLMERIGRGGNAK